MAETFDPVEETRDQMALLVEMSVNRVLCAAGRIALDMRHRPEFPSNELTQIIGVTGRVRDDMFDLRQPFEQDVRLRAVTPLARRDHKADRPAERINCSVDPCRQTVS